MTEDEARRVLLLQSREAAGASAHWSLDDRAWATAQAVAAAGEQARPEAFAVARATLALQRLLPRDAQARRWLEHRVWHPAWVLLAAAAGGLVGLLADQLGPPQQVNLLAPAVWAVVAWNLVVYGALLWPRSAKAPRPPGLAALFGPGSDSVGVAPLWARHAAPLTLQRLTLLMHTAAALLALGLVAGLYLRGLVLDYRAGWQSTFAEPATVQVVLALLLAPASALTGIAVPDIGPLRLAPGAPAQASAAPWIHLLAATLLLWVVLPRVLLALRAAWRAQRLSRRFPVPLDTPYFEALHPLMRPGPPRALRLLWAAPQPAPAVLLLGNSIGALDEPLLLLRSDQGDELQLHPVPAALWATASAPTTDWHQWRHWRHWCHWSRWWPTRDPLQRCLGTLQRDIDAVLLLTAPGAARPAWLAALARPVLVLVDAPSADAPQLSLQALDDGWLRGGRLFQALATVLPGDPRLHRLAQAWRVRQQARLDATVQVIADSLGRSASARVDVTPAAGDEAARQALAQALESESHDSTRALRDLLGLAAEASPACPVTASATVRTRVPEGRSALIGGAATGALAGLKADLLTGGMTMGAGLVTGLVLGALGSAGLARGINAARGTERSFAAWSNEVLDRLAQHQVAQALELAYGLRSELAAARLASAWAATSPLAATWATRDARAEPGAEARRLSQALRPELAAAFKRALGGP